MSLSTRSFFSCLLLLSTLSTPIFAIAVEGRILEVRRALRMSQAEPLPPKEFSLSLGTRDGIKEGDTLRVYRTISVTDTVAGQPYGEMPVYVGELRIHQASEMASVARAQRETEEMFRLGDQLKTGLPIR